MKEGEMRCLFCDRPVRKLTSPVRVRTAPSQFKPPFGRELIVETLPRTMADCQKLTSFLVVKVERQRLLNPETDKSEKTGFIDKFTEWDGVSYMPVEKYFCTNTCAMCFGHAAAEAGYRMKKRSAA